MNDKNHIEKPHWVKPHLETQAHQHPERADNPEGDISKNNTTQNQDGSAENHDAYVESHAYAHSNAYAQPDAEAEARLQSSQGKAIDQTTGQSIVQPTVQSDSDYPPYAYHNALQANDHLRGKTHSAPKGGVLGRLKGFISQLGSKTYHCVSMVGHCALVCGDLCTGKIFHSGRRGSRRPAFFALSALILLCASVSAFYYMMGTRSLSVNFLKADIEKSMSGMFAGANVHIDEALLQRDVEKGGLFIRLINMELTNQSGERIAATPEIGIGLKILPMMWGEFEPNSINIIAPTLHLVQNDLNEWTLWRGKVEQKNSAKNANKRLASSNKNKPQPTNDAQVDFARIGDFSEQGLAKAHGYLQQSINLSNIGVRKARIILHENKSGVGDVWNIPYFTLQYDSEGNKQLIGSGVIEHNNSPGASIWVSLMHGQGNRYVDLKTRLQNIVPAELSSLVPALESLRPVQVGVSGQMVARVHLVNGISSGHLKVALSDGYIGLGGDEGPKFMINRGAFEFNMKAGAKHIEMQQGSLYYPNGSISLKGDVWRDDLKSKSLDWRFELFSTAGEIIPNDPDLSSEKIDELVFSGRLFGAKVPVSIDEFRAKIGKGQIIMAHDDSVGYPAILRGQVTNVSANLLKAIWPEGFKQESRDWVFKNVKQGVIKRVSMALKAPGFGKRKALKGEKVNNTPLPYMKIDVADLAYTVFDDPLLIYTKKARVEIKGNSLVALMKRGQSKLSDGSKVVISDGKLTIADYEPKGPDGVISFKLKTTAQFIDKFLQRAPFSHKSALSQNTKNLTGDVSGSLKIAMPLSDDTAPKDVTIAGKLQLKKLKTRLGDFQIKNGLVNFDLGKNHIEAKGSMLVNGVSADVAWHRQILTSSKQAGLNSNSALKITGTYDEADRNQLGLQVNSFIQGAIPVEVTVNETAKGALDIHVLADLTKASIEAKSLGWEKAKGMQATLNLDVEKGDDSRVSLTNMKLDGQDLTVRGRIDLDEKNRVQAFDFPNISYKVISNIKLSGVLDKHKVWQMKGRGPTFDGRGLLKSMLQTGKAGAGIGTRKNSYSKGINIDAQFDTVIGWKQSKLSKFKIKMSRRGALLTRFNSSGTLLNGGSLTANLVSKKKSDPVIRVRSSDAGEAMRFIGFYPNMLGGQGQLTVRYNVKARKLASKNGELVITRFAIASDPVVKEVLSNISKGKKKKTVSGQDVVKFKKLVAPFSIGHGQFILHDSQVKGELLGATMRGSMDFQQKRLRLSGTYIPLYGLNAAVGAVPVLGDILVGRRGEGMLGITFGIYGNIEKPEVFVNPMSLVAPGVFRQIFEFDQGSQEIKARPDLSKSKGVKLESSASKVVRRKNSSKNSAKKNKRKPETSASSVVRRNITN